MSTYGVLSLLILLPVGLEALARALHLPLPGSILGYMVLLAWLATRETPTELDTIANAIVRMIPLFLVPPTVGILEHWPILRDNALALLVSVLAGTIAALVVTALTMIALLRLQFGRNITPPIA